MGIVIYKHYLTPHLAHQPTSPAHAAKGGRIVAVTVAILVLVPVLILVASAEPPLGLCHFGGCRCKYPGELFVVLGLLDMVARSDTGRVRATVVESVGGAVERGRRRRDNR